MNRTDVESRSAKDIVPREIEIEILQGRDGARGLVNRIDAFLRHRAMRGNAGRDRLKPQRSLVTDQRMVAGWLRHDKRAELRKGRHGSSQVRGTRAACFLTSSDEQDYPGRARQLVSQCDACGDERSHAAFHVGRAAPIELAVKDLGSERVD